MNLGKTPLILRIRDVISDLADIAMEGNLAKSIDDIVSVDHSAKSAYSLRRRRDALFNEAIFGEPSWDIMLDLYEAEARGRSISISSACIAAAVPQTTALRWVNVLLQKGYVERNPDPADARRSYLKLSDAARAKLDALFQPPDDRRQ